MKTLLQLAFFLHLFFATRLAAQWQPLPGPIGGYITCWAVTPSGVLYAGGAAGLFTSTDDGLTWQLLPGAASLGQLPVQLDWDNGNLYMVGQDHNTYANVLWKSSDNGTTWVNILSNLHQVNGTMGVFDAKNDTIVVNTNDSHISLDGGTTWQSGPGGGRWNIIGTNQGWFCSFYDAAFRWTGIGGWTTTYVASNNFVFPRRILEAGDFVFIFFEGVYAEYLYKTVADSTWQWGGLPFLYHENEVSVAERNDTIFLHGLDSIIFSTDGLQSWQPLPATGLTGLTRACLFPPSGAIVAITDSGVFRAVSPGADFLPTEGFSSQNSLAVLPEGNGNWWLGLSNGLYFSPDNGGSWEKMYPQLQNMNSEIRWIKRLGNHLIAGNNTRFFYSPTHGANWIERALPVVSGWATYDFSLIGHRLFYGDLTGTWFTDDWGATWQPFSPAPSGLPIETRVFAESDSLVAVAAQGSEVYLSRDTGATWQDFSAGLGGNLGFIAYEMAVGPQNLFVHQDYWMMASPLTGPDWQQVTLPVPTSGANGPFPSAFHFSGNTILTGTPGAGIFRSTDGANSWETHAPTGLYNLTNAYHFTDSLLTIATKGGIWYSGTIGSELVSGRVFADANQNAVFDSTDTPLAGHLVELKSQHLYAATDAQGRYAFDWRGQPDSLRLVPLSALPSNIGLAKYADVPGLAFDFPVVGSSQLGDLAIDITAAWPPRPGFEFSLYLTCRNNGYLPADARLSFVKDLVTTWSDFGELPDQLSGDTAQWLFSAVPPGGSKVVPVTLKLEAGISVGTILHLSGKVTLGNLLDVQGANNVEFYVLPVVGSFDPNDKSVSPEGDITPGMVADTQRLAYTIRFQNTGNFPAEFVRVTDLISPGLDLGSFRVEAASHPMTWSLEGRTVEFFFPDIQLPDNTSDEPASHGFVKYSIAMRPDLMKGDVVNNYADIFFDFNPPIRTNMVETKVDVISAVVSLPVPDLPCWVTPNPVSGELTVFWEGGTGGTARLQVFNLQGKLVITTLSESPAKVAVGSMKAGVYRLVVRAGAREGQVGFVKI